MMYHDLTEREEEKKQDHPEIEKQVEVKVAHMSTWNKTTGATSWKDEKLGPEGNFKLEQQHGLGHPQNDLRIVKLSSSIFIH